MSDLIQVTTTLASQADAIRLAQELVEARLAACVQISGPIHSVFRWQGRVCQEQEWYCTAKTLSGMFDSIKQFIRLHHPYDTPEILATRVLGTLSEYETWVSDQLALPTDAEVDP